MLGKARILKCKEAPEMVGKILFVEKVFLEMFQGVKWYNIQYPGSYCSWVCPEDALEFVEEFKNESKN